MKIRKHTPEESEAYKKFIYNHFTHTTCPLCKGKGIVPKPDTKDDVKATEDNEFENYKAPGCVCHEDCCK